MEIRIGTFGVLLLVLGGCSGLNPLQERAWDHFVACRAVSPTAVLVELREDGTLIYSTREASAFAAMSDCLQKRTGQRPTTH
ncbi:MAG: hypothetical protein HYV92_06085 [Candidatus Rokubacteria bacterium]|nr:hypothetical protein [Candidatus Rokubacteria bacterium]